MKSITVKLALHFISLVILQVLILNRVDMGGYASPYLYILFIITFPPAYDRVVFLIVSFVLGLTIDIFSNTSGVNALSSVILAVLHKPLCYLIFTERQTHMIHRVSLSEVSLYNYLMFISVFTLIHHFITFSLEIFSWRDFGTLIQHTLVSSAMTIFLILTLSFFSVKSSTR